MPILNANFEDAGANPGEAAHWQLVTYVARHRVAAFGPAPYRAWEDFERWVERKLAWTDGDLARAFFDPRLEGFENFEDAWDNSCYFAALPTGLVESCSFSGRPDETFAIGWGNDTFHASWAGVSAESGFFDTKPVEDFALWGHDESYFSAWALVNSAAALFDPGTSSTPNFETFETGWPSATTI